MWRSHIGHHDPLSAPLSAHAHRGRIAVLDRRAAGHRGRSCAHRTQLAAAPTAIGQSLAAQSTGCAGTPRPLAGSRSAIRHAQSARAAATRTGCAPYAAAASLQQPTRHARYAGRGTLGTPCRAAHAWSRKAHSSYSTSAVRRNPVCGPIVRVWGAVPAEDCVGPNRAVRPPAPESPVPPVRRPDRGKRAASRRPPCDAGCT